MSLDDVTDEELRTAARARIVSDRLSRRETPSWVLAIALSESPIDRHLIRRLRWVWEEVHHDHTDGPRE